MSHQTFVVTLNGKAYVIAPAHGMHGDKRYYTSPKSDTAVRLATEAEATHTISLDVRPSELPGKIVTLEGKLLTGESVRFESPTVRGLELLRVLLPDTRMSFHNWKRGVEVDYERMQIFILPPEWSYLNRLRIHRAAGFSGAPAIERTPQGDAVVGHFIGHRAIKVGGKKITLGIVEDHHAIRSAVEMFAAQSGKEANLNRRNGRIPDAHFAACKAVYEHEDQVLTRRQPPSREDASEPRRTSIECPALPCYNATHD